MKSINNRRLIVDGKMIDSLLQNSVKESVSTSKQSLQEAYVAEPKPFKQVSELVSQKTKDMHVGLYKNYVESLNAISAKLDTADRSEANPRHSDFKSLKLDEAYNLNAVWLHELYFANCFDPHSEIVMDSQAYLRLQRDFGTFDAWQKDFMATAMSAGNGWAVCGYHTFLRRYVNMIVSQHSGDVMLGVFPVIVVDMWEHSYTRDYLSDKKSYLVSQMKEFNWDVIEERFKRAESIAQAVRA
jgi:Fe-Mn family superoxide dismutase